MIDVANMPLQGAEPDEDSLNFQSAFTQCNYVVGDFLAFDNDALSAALTVLADYFIPPGGDERRLDFMELARRAATQAFDAGDTDGR